MHKTVMAALGLMELVIAPNALAQDTFSGTAGGFGGQPYALRCPAGTALTGIVGYTGAYFDGIAPVCDGVPQQRAAGKTGGNRGVANCPAGSVVVGMYVWTLRSDNNLVDSIRMFCAARGNPGQSTGAVSLLTPSKTSYGDYGLGTGPGGTLRCGAGKMAVGIQGGAGASVDRLGLICG